MREKGGLEEKEEEELVSYSLLDLCVCCSTQLLQAMTSQPAK